MFLSCFHRYVSLFKPLVVCQHVSVHMTCIILLYFGYRVLRVFFHSGAGALRQTAGVPYLVSCKKYLSTPHPN